MSTPIVPVVSLKPETLGEKIKNFFSEAGHELSVIGTDALKAIGIIQQDVSTYEPMVLQTIQEMFPGANIPAAKITNVIKTSLATSNAIASALQSEGLNPTLDQTAAIQMATAIHSLKVSQPATSAEPAAPAIN